MLCEEEKKEWAVDERKSANQIAGGMFLFICAWTAFLLIILAPSCPNKTPEYYFGYAQHYSSEGDYVQAVRFFTKAIEKKTRLF